MSTAERAEIGDVGAGGMEAWTQARRTVGQRLRLTDRWTDLRPHEGQQTYFWHPARFRVNPSGRRSGKTELAKRGGVLLLPRKNKIGGPVKIFYGAPSFGQAKDIFWQDLQDLIPPHWVAHVNKTDLEIVTKWGAIVRVFGFDRPRRIEGVIWDQGYLDELADCPRGCVTLNVRPALATAGREGRCDFLGVPDEVGRNQAEYEQLWETGLRWRPGLERLTREELARTGADPEVCSFHWPSTTVLNPKEIESLRRGMDPLAFEQEMGGRFVRSGGKALPKFDVTTHVNDYFAAYCRELPLDFTMDFGTNPAASLICQTFQGYVWVLDEIVLNDSSTDVAAAAFIERCGLRQYSTARIRLFGDAAGNSPHSNIGKSDYTILREALRGYRVEWRNLSVNPPIKDTLNAVRGRTANAVGEVRLHVHPRCRNLINDLKTAPWPSDLREYHTLAALRYYCYSLFGQGNNYETSRLELPGMGAGADTNQRAFPNANRIIER